MEAVSFSAIPNRNQFSIINQAVQFVVTEGQMNFVGVAFHTFKKDFIRIEDMTLEGSGWKNEGSFYTPSYGPSTDTVGDSLYFEFEGTGVQLLLGQRDASGQVDVWYDGVKVNAGLDLYNGGKYAYPLNLFTTRDADNYDRGYGKHTVRVKLVGVNASAVASFENNRRLFLYGAFAIDNR